MDVGDVINGWRIVEDAGAGRSGHVFIVCREGDPDRLFALKMQRTDRPRSALDMATRLRTCKPPHHRFRAIVKYTALAFASAVFIYGIVMFWSFMARRSDIRKCCADPIAAKAELDTADAYCAHGDMTNAVRHLRAAAFLGSEEATNRLKALRLRSR